MNNFEEQSYLDHYHDNSYRYSNYYNNNNNNGRRSAPPNQHPFRYSNEQQMNNYYHSYQQQNNLKRTCYQCGNPDHIKAHCPLLKKTNSVHQQKPSS
jgi:hypothetical protein